MRFRVLVSAPYMQAVIERFEREFEVRGAEIVMPMVSERLSEKDLLALVGDIDGVIAGDDEFTETVIRKAIPRLKVLSKWGTGIDSFDLEACARFGVRVFNTPNAFTEAVADSVMGYMLCFSRRLPWMDRHLKSGSWEKLQGRALHEQVLGIIGVGNIGKAVARRAAGFGMRLLGNDLVDMPTEFLEETGIEMRDKTSLLEQADFVTLNCDLNPTSHHLMDRRRLATMKNTAVLINSARGPIIDEPALVEALESGGIAGAALDVFEQEPLPMDSPLRNMDQVMLAPHNSNSSPCAWDNVHRNTLKNLFAVLENR